MRGERNLVIKDRRKVGLKFALAYPNVYGVGMSNLGVRLLYEYINNRQDALCERFFFTKYGDLPRSMESRLALQDFDVVGFSLQHEMDYVRMLDMLSSSGIPIRSADRKAPLVIAGGPSVSANPLPVSRFVDYVVVGEAEPVLDELLTALAANDHRRLRQAGGIYRAGGSADRLVVQDLDTAYHPVRQIHSQSPEEFSSSFLLEVSRGCSRGCRFCMECFLYHPRRQRSLSKVDEILDEGIASTSLKRVTCISSAFFDHTELVKILASLKARGLRFSLPSVRISETSDELMGLLAAGGQRSITIAPETPSPRLREVINKRFTDDELHSLLAGARGAGINSLKVYLMVGVPGETMADLEEMDGLLKMAISSGFRPPSIHISVNPMVPKSNTPFQWSPILPAADYSERVAFLRRICSLRGVRRFECMDHRWGVIQAYLSTSGDGASRILSALVDDLRAGGGGDLGSWRRVLRSMGSSLEKLHTPPSLESDLPWEAIKGAIPKSHLIREHGRAMSIASRNA